MKKRYLLLFFILLSFSQGYGQSTVIDSLKTILKTQKEDTGKVNNLIALCTAYNGIDSIQQVVDYGSRALALANKINYPKGIALSCLTLARVYMKQGDYSKSLTYYKNSLSEYTSLQDKNHEATIYTNIGILYERHGDYPASFDCHLKAITLYNETGNKSGEAKNICCLGNIALDQNDLKRSLEYYSHSVRIYDSLGDKFSSAQVKSNMGNVYKNLKEYNKALLFYTEALKFNEKINDKEDIARIISNIGNIYKFQGDYSKAFANYLRAEQIYDSLGEKRGYVTNTGNIGVIYLLQNQYKLSEKFLLQAAALSDSCGYLDNMKDAELNLSKLYAVQNEWKKAFEYYKSYTNIKDSLINQDKSKEIGRIEAKSDYDKQLAIQQGEEDKKTALAAAESKSQKIVIGFITLIAVAIAILAAIIFRALSLTRKQKLLIEQQKSEVELQKTIVTEQKNVVEQQKFLVEAKNKEILDSITYAKRLQDAILPPLNIIKQYLPESFVLYKPKDIVAGDFYWMERTGDSILIAAADCTGHGVPGALVSVVCSNALNRTVKEFHIVEPGKILDKVRELVLETFEKSEANVQDGMDISLCCINTKTNAIQWSGAYNSLWYIQNGEIHEVAADKQPIGKIDKPQLFHTHSLHLQKGDTLYLLTDGYADQFGGPKGKKFKYKHLQDVLLANAAKSLEEQKNILQNTLEEWKGNLEQVDDILVIGIKI